MRSMQKSYSSNLGCSFCFSEISSGSLGTSRVKIGETPLRYFWLFCRTVMFGGVLSAIYFRPKRWANVGLV